MTSMPPGHQPKIQSRQSAADSLSVWVWDDRIESRSSRPQCPRVVAASGKTTKSSLLNQRWDY